MSEPNPRRPSLAADAATETALPHDLWGAVISGLPMLAWMFGLFVSICIFISSKAKHRNLEFKKSLIGTPPTSSAARLIAMGAPNGRLRQVRA